MDPIYHFAPNPFPADLREELPYPSAPWLVGRELFKRLAAAPEVAGKLYKKIELQPDDPEAMFIQKYYGHNPPQGKGIRAFMSFILEIKRSDLKPRFATAKSKQSSSNRTGLEKAKQSIAMKFMQSGRGLPISLLPSKSQLQGELTESSIHVCSHCGMALHTK